MFQEYLASTDLLLWPLVGLVIFVVAFVAVLGYVLVVRRERSFFDRVAALPLEDDLDSHDSVVERGAST